jgi:hypothetical protein
MGPALRNKGEYSVQQCLVFQSGKFAHATAFCVFLPVVLLAVVLFLELFESGNSALWPSFLDDVRDLGTSGLAILSSQGAASGATQGYCQVDAFMRVFLTLDDEILNRTALKRPQGKLCRAVLLFSFFSPSRRVLTSARRRCALQ